MRTHERLLCALGAGCGAVVAIVALTTAGPASRATVTPGTERALFDAIVVGEPAARVNVLEEWASHRWSQEDAFGATERERIVTLAAERRLSPQALFRVLDDGLRLGWTGPGGAALRSTVAPLKPRSGD